MNEEFGVKSITIADDVKVGSFDGEGIYRLERLRELSYLDKKVKLDFSRLPRLEVLKAVYSKNFERLACLKNLKELLVVSAAPEDCSFLVGLDDLISLRMSGGSVVSMKGVGELRSLASVKLDYMSKVEDASDLSNVAGLTDIYVERCKRLKDFSFVSNSKSVAKLFASEIDSLAFVPSCKRLRDLSFLSLADGDMTPIFESKTLERVYFTPNKKHYTHTLDEVLNLIGR